MKKFTILFITLTMLLCACGGNVSVVKLDTGESDIYSEREIKAAMDKVIDYFDREFDGCTLIELRYDEEKSLLEADKWAEQYGAKEAIVLHSDFYVAGSGASPSLNPDFTYTDWTWILVRNGGSWQLKDWGY